MSNHTDWFLNIKAVRVFPAMVPLVNPFQTSFGTQQNRATVLIQVERESGASGWGEVTANWEPGYSYETVKTALHILDDFLVPALMQTQNAESPDLTWLKSVRGHPLAKHGITTALLSALASEQGRSFADFLHSLSNHDAERRERVEVGVSIGIQPSIDATIEKIGGFVAEGYGRVKLKIKPKWDVDMLREVRAAFPDLLIMADANSAYTMADADHLKQLDALNLLMIEQPFAHHDIYEHSQLQPLLDTPICLDESLHSLNDVKLAHKVGACKIVNLKPQRVGGMLEAVAVHDYCAEQGIDLWIGGMLELGVGRAASLALASLSGVTMPCDLSATNRYYDPDIADPPFDLNQGESTITVPNEVGLGVSVNYERLMRAVAAFRSEF